MSEMERHLKWDAGKVIDGLFVGSIRSLNHPSALKYHNITHILTASDRVQVTIEQGIQHLVLKNLMDHPSANILPHLENSLNFIDDAMLKQKTGILVHCVSGVSRSVSLCCAWLMLRKKYTYEDALSLVQKARRLALPNAGFQAQLRLLEKHDGNIPAASKCFQILLKDQSVTDIIREQRTSSNQIHTQVDQLEEQIQTKIPTITSTKNTWMDKNRNISNPNDPYQSSQLNTHLFENYLNKLDDLQNKLDQISISFANDTTLIEDRPARIIRKAAAMKINRLRSFVRDEQLSQQSHIKEKE